MRYGRKEINLNRKSVLFAYGPQNRLFVASKQIVIYLNNRNHDNFVVMAKMAKLCTFHQLSNIMNKLNIGSDGFFHE